MLMEPEDWKREWGEDNLVFLPEDCNQLPSIARGFLTSYGLPRRIIIENNNDLEVDVDISFEISFEFITQPHTLYDEMISWGVPDTDIEKAWSQKIIIGEEEYCGGHAQYCVHHLSETVTRIDVELDDPEDFVNSSVPQFGETLLLAVRWSRANQQANMENWKASFYELAEAIKAVDAEVFQYQGSFWAGLINYAIDNEVRSLEITADLKRS